jgi:hypothetical protein
VRPRELLAPMWMAPLVVGLAGWPANAQWLNEPARGIPRTADGQPALTAPAPRTADGRPDLSGHWQKRVLTSDVKDEDLLPWVKAVFDERRENLGKDSPWVMCLPLGPMEITDALPVKFVHTAGLLVSLREDLSFRQIFLDGRKLPPDPNPSWMGYSVGRWEGDTLIVDSIGFTERSWLVNGYAHSEGLRITETYRRRSLGHMDLEVTVEDPTAFRRPWTVTFAMTLEPDTELLEYVCNENEKSRAHMVGRLSDTVSTDVDPAVLDTYVGTYEMKRNDGLTLTFEVTREDRTLFLQRTGRAKARLSAISPTRFRGVAEYQFFSDANGTVTHFTLISAEGQNIVRRIR